MGSLNELECAVIEKLLDADTETCTILKKQCQALKVTNRKMTGVGFFTYLATSGDAPVLPDAMGFEISDVGAKLNGALEVGFVLFIREGRLHDLEGFTYDDPWPDVVTSFELFYDGTSERR